MYCAFSYSFKLFVSSLTIVPRQNIFISKLWSVISHQFLCWNTVGDRKKLVCEKLSCLEKWHGKICWISEFQTANMSNNFSEAAFVLRFLGWKNLTSGCVETKMSYDLMQKKNWVKQCKILKISKSLYPNGGFLIHTTISQPFIVCIQSSKQHLFLHFAIISVHLKIIHLLAAMLNRIIAQMDSKLQFSSTSSWEFPSHKEKIFGHQPRFPFQIPHLPYFVHNNSVKLKLMSSIQFMVDSINNFSALI